MTNDMHALAGAYVLDALDPEEREAFEGYLRTSPATADEVRSLREVAATLAAAAAETPPEGLRRAVMATVDTTRQDRPAVGEDLAEPARGTGFGPPTTPPVGGASPSTTAAASRSRSDGLHDDAGPAEGLATVTALVPPSSRLTRLVMGVAAAAVLVAIGLGATVAGLASRLDQVEATSAQVAMLAAAPDSVRHETAYPGGGTVTALVSPGHGAMAVAEDLPALPDDQVYALWGLTDDAPIPVGALVDGEPLTIDAAGLAGLAITVEPAGPLTAPTGEVTAAIGA